MGGGVAIAAVVGWVVLVGGVVVEADVVVAVAFDAVELHDAKLTRATAMRTPLSRCGTTPMVNTPP
jgi:hypothetical protein